VDIFQSLDMLVDSGLNCTVGAMVPRGDEEGAFHTNDWTNPKSVRSQEVDHVAMALAAGAYPRLSRYGTDRS